VVRKHVGGHRWAATLVVFAVAITAVGAVAPGSVVATPRQEGLGETPGEVAAGDEALLEIDVQVADGDAAAITGALDEIHANVGAQLSELNAAELTIASELEKLAAADESIRATEGRIETLTSESDSVVVSSFMNPPSEAAIDSLTADSLADATIKQALLDMRLEEESTKLAELQAERRTLVDQKAHEEQVRQDAADARAAAEQELADLEAAAEQQTAFILDVREWLESPDGARALANNGPAEAARVQSMTEELAGKIGELETAEATREAEALAREERRRLLEGGFICPLAAPSRFSNDWGEPRPGGRTHKGTDMMSPTGTPVVAPADGRVVHKGDSIGGMSFYLYGDDGNEYFGTHLSEYENVGVGWVEAGTLIGRVGATGNASTPHLHFSYYPAGGSPTNPYHRLAEVCPRV
jgi:murein DD-endopeptidase MepM/ murein hydrolase activator NlpD